MNSPDIHKVLTQIIKIILISTIIGATWFSVTYYQNYFNCFSDCGSFHRVRTQHMKITVNSFNSCVSAGNPIIESYPRQCRTPDGRTFVEEIPQLTPTYTNATSGVITVTTPTPGAVTGKEFEVRGSARGWYFEGSFPVEILDTNGKILANTPAQAQSDWMTNAPVSFIAKIKILNNYTGKATIILKKDNPSGVPGNDASVSFPITIEY